MSLKGTIILTGAAGGIASGLITEHLKTTLTTQYHNIYIDHPSTVGRLSSFLSIHAPSTQQYEIIPLDLSSQSAIRTFTSSINSRISSSSLPPIRGLLLIAGGIFNSKSTKDGVDFTAEGLEKTFAINYLANFLLVLLLLQSMDKEAGRIIFMSSTTHDPSFFSNRNGYCRGEEWRLLWRDVEAMAKGATERVKGGDEFGASMRRYGTSKFLMCLFMCVLPILHIFIASTIFTHSFFFHGRGEN
jgi:NAD(P)-dependent dehydrogenase (short-subunit alcohol dehydrogenase family)